MQRSQKTTIKPNSFMNYGYQAPIFEEVRSPRQISEAEIKRDSAKFRAMTDLSGLLAAKA